jgi:NADPH:quinone reductase-like Zn-dependent oxidoreductase
MAAQALDQLPTTMRAVKMEKRGPAKEALVFYADHALPQRKPHQVLLAAAATSVAAGDWKLRSGFAPIPLKLPKILGEDVSGVVLEAPPGSKFKRGDRVFACTGQVLSSDPFGAPCCACCGCCGCCA